MREKDDAVGEVGTTVAEEPVAGVFGGERRFDREGVEGFQIGDCRPGVEAADPLGHVERGLAERGGGRMALARDPVALAEPDRGVAGKAVEPEGGIRLEGEAESGGAHGADGGKEAAGRETEVAESAVGAEGLPEVRGAPFAERGGTKVRRRRTGRGIRFREDDLETAVAAGGERGEEARAVAAEEPRVVAIVDDRGREEKGHGAGVSTVSQGMPPRAAAVGAKVLPEDARRRTQRERVQRSTTAPRIPASVERSEEPSRKRRREP